MTTKSNSSEKIWRVDIEKCEYQIQNTPAEWIRLGGRGLTSRILLDEVPPTCNPLGPFNELILAPGLLAGHALSSADRLSVGGKSPLTGGIKESNAGGTTARQMARLAIKALIIQGQPQEDTWYTLLIDGQQVHFVNANPLLGLGIYETAKRLRKQYGEKAAIALIGPGGEMRLAAAGICNLDKDGTPSRIAGRGGLGAVMGSKGIKAILFLPPADSIDGPTVFDPQAFKAARKIYTTAILKHPKTASYQNYGTAANSHPVNALGALPTRNFSRGQFEHVEDISGETMRDRLLERKGACKTTHACMAGCVIQSSNIYGDAQGNTIVAPIEYETIGLMGANLEIRELDDIARLNFEVNDLGLDSIETGAALGVAGEAGVFEFGSFDSAMKLLNEIRNGTPLGRMLGNGATTTGHVLGITRIPAVKGQAMSAYDPRAIKGTGVTYATSPQGADHTCGLTLRANVKHTETPGQVDASRSLQINNAGVDTVGLCLFTGFGLSTVPNVLADLLNAKHGWSVEEDILQCLGRETLKIEREFNRQAGFTPADDRIPEWMQHEAFPPHNAVFDVPDQELDDLFNW
jgi:aldehyde:ferredoxin oxidoreductase